MSSSEEPPKKRVTPNKTALSPSNSSIGDEFDAMVQIFGRPSYCPYCHQTPCDWVVFGDILREYFYYHNIGSGVTNEEIRKDCYKRYLNMTLGWEGEKKKGQVPFCVHEQIRHLFPTRKPGETFKEVGELEWEDVL